MLVAGFLAFSRSGLCSIYNKMSHLDRQAYVHNTVYVYVYGRRLYTWLFLSDRQPSVSVEIKLGLGLALVGLAVTRVVFVVEELGLGVSFFKMKMAGC